MPLQKLLNGFRKFRASYFEKTNLYGYLVRNGQVPETLVIACSDSRNDPALITQSKPGDMFVVRNVAAIVPPYHPDSHHHGTSAAIEFAVRGLKVQHIVVLGHALCGGVQTLADLAENNSGSQFEFLTQWIQIGETARQAVAQHLPDAPRALKLQALEQAVILTSLNNLMTFPWIRQGVENGSITLHGWYFDMVHGKLLSYDFNSGTFTEAEEESNGFTHTPEAGKTCACDHWSVEQLIRKSTKS